MTYFSIILGTYGEEHWRERAESLAVLCTETQTYDDFEVVQYHGDTLASARNKAAEGAHGDFLIFLDTGDYLDREYLTAMSEVDGDIRRPSVLGFDGDGWLDDGPILSPRPTSLLHCNFIVIGAAVNREMFLSVGGFSELPVLEDWELWLKLVCNREATITDVPRAMYLICDDHDRSKHPYADVYAQRIRRSFRYCKALV